MKKLSGPLQLSLDPQVHLIWKPASAQLLHVHPLCRNIHTAALTAVAIIEHSISAIMHYTDTFKGRGKLPCSIGGMGSMWMLEEGPWGHRGHPFPQPLLPSLLLTSYCPIGAFYFFSPHYQFLPPPPLLLSTFFLPLILYPRAAGCDSDFDLWSTPFSWCAAVAWSPKCTLGSKILTTAAEGWCRILGGQTKGERDRQQQWAVEPSLPPNSFIALLPPLHPLPPLSPAISFFSLRWPTLLAQISLVPSCHWPASSFTTASPPITMDLGSC